MKGGGTATDAYSFVLDKSSGTVRYEGRFQRFEDRGWAEHTRLLLTGVLDDELNFVDLTGFEGANGAIYGNDGVNVNYGIFMTAQGKQDTPFRAHTYIVSSHRKPAHF